MFFIRRTLFLASIILYTNAAYGCTTPASVVTTDYSITTTRSVISRWVTLTTPSVSNNQLAELNCTFEYGTCGYYQTAEDDFDWTRHQGSTPSSGTGPSGDHTTGTGYYMYIETTSVPAYWTARLASSSQDATDNQGLCLSFFYHMYGYNINTLSVFLSTRGNEELIFRRSQYQGDRWLRATTQFRSSSTWRIIFEGRRGRDYQGDIAIDDISIFPGPCPTEAGHSTSSAPASTTCYCYSGCSLYNECCSYCRDWRTSQPGILPSTTTPVRTRCHCFSWCNRYNECCSHCQNWYITQSAGHSTTSASVSTTCYCYPGCARYNECCSYCRDWNTTQPGILPSTTPPVRTRCNCFSWCNRYNECCSHCQMSNNQLSELNCTFEYGTCGYYQMAEDDFDWTRHQGATPSSGTGPSGDHTTGTGYYMYIETTSVPAYWTARLASSSQDATDDQGLCLSFFYHMHGYNINTLSVFLSTRGNEELIFRRSQYQGDWWLRATTQFRSSSTWRIIFEGRRGRDYQGDIAIDDISIFPGPCPTKDLPTTQPGSAWATDDWYITQLAGQSTTSAPVSTRTDTDTSYQVSNNQLSELNCTFEYGTCGYNQRSDDDFDWTRYRGSTLSRSTGPSGDHTTGTGYYMYIETSPESANSTARLASSSQDATGNRGLCLSFFYHMYGENINTLSVFLSTGGNEELIFIRSQNQGNRWWRATTQFRSSWTWRIIFEGRTGRDYQGDIAVDDISIFPGPCPTEDLPTTQPELNCTFEYGTCGYYQMAEDDFDWTRHQGSTPSSGTGPSGDHTTGTGYYMYMETTSVSDYSTARLASSSQDATDNQGLCLSFFYHMHGYNINTLSVFLSTGGNEELIFRRSQNQGNTWWRATAQIRSSSIWRIIFEGRRGTGYSGDIAIDDISIVAGPCATEDLPTTQLDLPTTQPGCYCYQGCELYNDCCSYCPGLTPLVKVVFVDSVYKFTSPNFPGKYSNDLTARWHFSTFEGFQLLLKFQVLVTETSYDFVKVGNGNSTDRQVALHWSGGPPESEVQFLSSENALWMTLKTDSSVTATGFEATIDVVNISLSALDCDDFHCVSDGVCIPHSRVCNRVAECGSESDQEHCAGWNTELPGSNWATVDPYDEITLHCEPTSFQVDFSVQALPYDAQPEDLFLSGDPFDPSCRGFQNGDDYVSLNSSLTGCGTVFTESETLSSYLNWVAYTTNASRVVQLHRDDLPIQCDYDRSKQLQSHFVITDESNQRIKRAKGSFIYDFGMYTNMSFDVRYYSYPVETTLDRYLYFRAELRRSPDNLRIHLRSCRATPSQNFDDVVVYEFIHDGCVINNADGRVLTPSSPVQADFRIESFRFWPGLSNHTSQVWIHCEVVVCDVNDLSSECLHDCEQSRSRRSVAKSSREGKRLIQGPILFTDIKDLEQKSGVSTSMTEHGDVNIFTVALTAVSLVMFLSLLVVGGALFKIMRRVKRLEYRPLQNEKYTTI